MVVCVEERPYRARALETKLGQITKHPVTVMEAPGGFGKTTAAASFLEAHGERAEESRVHWYSCYGESVEKAWDGICRLLAEIDPIHARMLRGIGTPTEDRLADLADVMRRFAGGADAAETGDCFLIIDNFQYVQDRLPVALVEVMAVHNNPNFHILFLTQSTAYSDNRLWQNNRVYCIGADSFFFSPEEIEGYFRHYQLSLSPAVLAQLKQSTQGWAAALHIHRLSLAETGKPCTREEQCALIKSAVWRGFGSDARRFLAYLSVFRKFSVAQGVIMLETDKLSPEIVRLLESNAFVRYSPRDKSFRLHPMLRLFSMRVFEKYPPAETRKLLTLAGLAYRESGDNLSAFCCFQDAGAYDQLLSLVPDLGASEAAAAFRRSDRIVRLAETCPPEILLRHPAALPVLALWLSIPGGNRSRWAPEKEEDEALLAGGYGDPRKVRQVPCCPPPLVSRAAEKEAERWEIPGQEQASDASEGLWPKEAQPAEGRAEESPPPLQPWDIRGLGADSAERKTDVSEESFLREGAGGAFFAPSDGCPSPGRRMIRLMEGLLSDPAFLARDPDRARQLRISYYRVQGLTGWNDLSRMGPCYQQAVVTAGNPGDLQILRTPETGPPSLLYIFWHSSGSLLRTVTDLERYLPYYRCLTGEHGAGANALIRGEMLLMQGEDIQAEALCHKALYLATVGEQPEICFSAEMTLARIAALRGDARAYTALLENLGKRGQSGGSPEEEDWSRLDLPGDGPVSPQEGGAQTLALILAFLSPQEEETADWLFEPEEIQKRLLPLCYPFGMTVCLELLYTQRSAYAKVAGIGEAFLETLDRPSYLMPKLYTLLILTAAYQKMGHTGAAKNALSRALDLALPDGVLLPFVEHGGRLRSLLVQESRWMNQPGAEALRERALQGEARLSRAFGGSPLTPREQEVAQYAVEGMSNKQIAETLFLSLSTVKTLLSRVYDKLQIQSRAQLKDHL